jgi:hypothetical protein
VETKHIHNSHPPTHTPKVRLVKADSNKAMQIHVSSSAALCIFKLTSNRRGKWQCSLHCEERGGRAQAAGSGRAFRDGRRGEQLAAAGGTSSAARASGSDRRAGSDGTPTRFGRSRRRRRCGGSDLLCRRPAITHRRRHGPAITHHYLVSSRALLDVMRAAGSDPNTHFP